MSSTLAVPPRTASLDNQPSHYLNRIKRMGKGQGVRPLLQSNNLHA